MLFIFSILPTNPFMNEYFGQLMKEYFSNYIWFIMMYLVGAYLKLYKNDKWIELLNPILLLVSAFWVIWYIKGKQKDTINNFPLFLLGLSIFMFFICQKEWHSKIINFISSSVLGVYLIHDNSIIRPYLWKKVNINLHIGEYNFWEYEIKIILIIFFSCLLIDKIRQFLLEKPFFFIYDKIENKIQKYKEKKDAT